MAIPVYLQVAVVLVWLHTPLLKPLSYYLCWRKTNSRCLASVDPTFSAAPSKSTACWNASDGCEHLSNAVCWFFVTGVVIVANCRLFLSLYLRKLHL